MPVSRMIPIIRPVIAAEARGASRKGRYPTRSTIMPTNEVRNMEKRMVRTRISQLGMARTPQEAKAMSDIETPKPMYEPTMKISPWAKLKSMRMLYTMEYPSAIRA